MTTDQQKFTVQDVAPVGTWDASAKIMVTAKEWEFIYNFNQMLQSLPMICNGIYQRCIQDGTIKTQYLYPDGTNASPEHIQQFKDAVSQMQNRLANSKEPAQMPEQQETAKTETAAK